MVLPSALTVPWSARLKPTQRPHGLALWALEGDGCGREELAMRLYRFADDVATGGRLWASTVEYARELAEAGCRRAASGTFP
jgi:hypothetical protein